VTGASPTTAERGAAIVLIATGLGFGLPAPWVLEHFRRTGELPMTPFGFRAMSGPFERLGPDAFGALLVALAAVCAADVAAGVLTWRGDPRGPRLAALATPPGVVLALGFALPFYLAAVPAWATLLAVGRRR
jgi:hypothetical protein